MVVTDIEACLQGIGLRMKRIRVDRKMSLQDVADASGMSKTHMWEIEQGRSKNLTVKTLLKLSVALETTPARLMDFDFINSSLSEQEIQVALAARKIYTGANA